MNPDTKFQLKTYISSEDFEVVDLEIKPFGNCAKHLFRFINNTMKRQPSFLSSKWLLHI